jgi:threonine synthase
MPTATHFISTRGQAAEADFAQILLAGLAGDGGLYLPMAWPQIDPAAVGGACKAQAAQGGL